MLDLLGHCHLLADGATTLEVWSTRLFVDRTPDPRPGGLGLLGLIRRLLLEPGNRRVIATLIEDESWHASPMFAIDEVFADLVERGVVGLRARPGLRSTDVFGSGSGSAISTPVGSVEPLVRPGIDDVNEPTFIEVALRDDAMPTVLADYVLQTDGTPRPGRFIDERAVRVEPIDPEASCCIVLEHIPVPYRPAAEPIPSEEPSVEPPATEPAETTLLELVIHDEAGQPVRAQVYRVLRDGEPAHEGTYEGTIVRFDRAAASARYTVALQGLQLPITGVAA